MKNRVLITTADEATWPKDPDTPVLFLGEWCRLYSRREKWSKMDAAVVPYHWDDRKKLFSDYQYLQTVYDFFLKKVSEKLNTLHSVEHSERYWRILIGPWLGYFIQILFDRWQMIQIASQQFSICSVKILQRPAQEIVSNDMDQFCSYFSEDFWNEAIYGHIIKQWTTLPHEVRPSCGISPKPADAPKRSFIGRPTKSKVLNTVSILLQKASSEKSPFFISPYVPHHHSLLLQVRLGAIPKLWCKIPCPKCHFDNSMRQWSINHSPGDTFLNIAADMIPRQIPIVYIEGYRALRKQTDHLPWPRNPKVIFTSNAYGSDDTFKEWAAKKIESGTPLVIGQHGGHYGGGLWSFSEDHQIAVSDKFLSWGWKDDRHSSKIIPVGQLKYKTPLGIDHGAQKKLLMVSGAMPRYSYFMYSAIVARQWLDYFEDQVKFVATLPDALRSEVLLRLYPLDYGWAQKMRWYDQFPDLAVDDGQSRMDDLIRQSRIYISTYNATTFLESFTMNVPTVIFWNPEHWELRASAQPYFDTLERVGIFHRTPESAAIHVGKVWDDVNAWWADPGLQKAVAEFKQVFCHIPDDLNSRIKDALKEAVKASDLKKENAAYNRCHG